jgi:predicted RNA-binding protein associated with RNAse of E/G family
MRPPGREQVFRQTLVHEEDLEDGGRVLITYMAEAGVPTPVTVAGLTILEAASPAVWFTFPDRHHDIGRFHTPAGELTGYYANVLTPVEVIPGDGAPDTWRTTDLFVDLFVTPDGDVHELDRNELREALERGWIDDRTAAAADAELARLAGMARAGVWPPPIVEEWTLERARPLAGHGTRATDRG